ncbi:MAG: carbon-nitrogen hydrolase family protein [Acidobacteria bacterium]|nr:carbon-nitrogen hydrolase family protein [Acidobacteriota bacterium]
MRLPILLMALATAAVASDVSFTIAGVRVMPERWDKQANFAKLERWTREAAARGADLVVAPEGFLEGYVGNEKSNPDLTREKYFAAGETLDGPLLGRVRSLARESKVYLSLGFAERRDERMYNTSVIFSPRGDLVSRYSKSHTNDDEPFNTKGAEFPVAETPLGRWGTLICFDRQLPETARILAVKGAQVILVPSYGMYGETNDVMMRTRALENSVWVAFVHPRRCLIADPGGKVAASDDGGGDQLVTARIVLDNRIGRGPIRFRRPEIYGEILKPVPADSARQKE